MTFGESWLRPPDVEHRGLFPRKSSIKRAQVKESGSESHSVVSDSLGPYGLYSPWNSPGQNIGVCSLSLLQVISQPRNQTQVSCIAGRFLTSWATRKALKNLLTKVKQESEKVGLKLSIQKTKIIAFGPIASWKIDGEIMETVRNFILGAPKSL